MQSRNSVKVSYFLKGRKKEESSLSMRITVNSVRKEVALKYTVNSEVWSQERQRIKGKNKKACVINDYLDVLYRKVFKLVDILDEQEVPFTAELIKEVIFDGKPIPTCIKEANKPKISILSLIDQHNEEQKTILNKYTMYRYYRTRRYLKECLMKYYGVEDMPLEEFQRMHAKKFETFLLAKKPEGKGQSYNSMIKIQDCVSKIITEAISNGIITIHPYATLKYIEEVTYKDILTIKEMTRMYKGVFVDGYEYVRDIFLFCCYTGLSYGDVKSLKPSDIHEDNAGNLWIIGKRIKTKVPFHIPLLDEIPLSIFEKYKDHPGSLKRKSCFPVNENAVMNRHLKKIASECGIAKRVTTHTARHTFGTLRVNEGISLYHLKSMMGHTNEKMTQKYTQIMPLYLVRAMEETKEQRLLK